MSLIHWVIVILVIMVVFGAGRIPNIMGDVAEGIKAFKRGMKDEDADQAAPPKKVEDASVIDQRAEQVKTKDSSEI